ncbi:MMPL family transporter [Myxococcota bacterium]|nr:MMPL family transporter [Myxococcota bacterium]MCZ7617791.1 MMPL family transporter [Myxococcota bacterium]
MAIETLDAAVGRIAGACIDASQRHARVVVAASLVLAGLALGWAAGHLGVNSNTDDLLSEDLPHRRHHAALTREFGDSGHDLIVVVDGATVTLAHEAARTLSERFAADGARFEKVATPGSGAFFDRNGLLYLDVEELERLADRLARAQPLLAELAREPTLPRLLELLARAVRETEFAAVPADELAAVLERVTEVVASAGDAGALPLAWDDWLLGDASVDGVSAAPRRRVIQVTPRVDFGAFGPAREAVARVAELVREAGLEKVAGVRVRVTGDLALSTEELSRVRGQAAAQGAGSLVAVTILLLIGLRSGRLVLHAVVTLIVGLAWTTGFAALAIGHLNLLSVAFAVLFIGLGIDYGIHFLMRWLELRDAGADVSQALREAGRSVGTSLFLCAVTTSIGFYAFVPTGFVGIAELGVIAGTGMFLSLLATLTLLPALVRLLPPTRGRRGLGAVEIRLPEFPLRHPRAVCAAALLLAIGALFVVPQLRFDSDPLNVRDPGTESVQTMRDLVSGRRPSPWTAELLAPDLAAATRLAARLESLPEVEHAVTLTSFVPARQPEKLAILDDVRLFLGDLTTSSTPPPVTVGRVERALAQLREAVEERLASHGPTPIGDDARRLVETAETMMSRFDVSSESASDIIRLEDRLLGDLRGWLVRLDLLLRAEPVTLDTLPASLHARFVAPSGSVRIEGFAREDLSDPGAMERFVAAVLAEEPSATGAAVMIIESARAIENAMIRALGYAFAAITLLLLVLWRSVTDTLLALAPLVFASLVTAAAAVLLGLPINFADVIVLPLLLGIGVDSGVHLIHRFRHQPSAGDPVLGTSTARAVFFSAGTTLASFGSLGFSTHLGIASLGRLLALGIAIMLIANLIVLPAMLSGRGVRRDLAAPR